MTEGRLFCFPIADENEYYVHRIGRTGRAKRHGVAYTFVAGVTEDLRMDEIVRGTRNTVKKLRYNKGTLEEL